MANALYTAYKQALLTGNGPDLTDGNLKVTLVDAADYTVNLATDDFIADVPAGARVATATLSSVTATGGVLDSADPTFSSVTGDPSEALVLWYDTTVEATSRLVAYIDTATGLPVTPNGTNIPITWDSGANKILAL